MSIIERERTKPPTLGEIRPGAAEIDIVLAYRQAVVRRGLSMLLGQVSDFRLVAETADFDGARACVAAHAPKVLVLDLDQPKGAPLEAISLLAGAFPATSLVAMSARQDAAFVRAAISAGARGYVASAETAGELTRTIRRAASSTAAPYPALYAVPAISSLPPAGPCELSPRESEVLGLIAIGYTNAEIGGRLMLSVRTVETHRSHIRDKLGSPTRAGLVEYAFAHGIHALNP